MSQGRYYNQKRLDKNYLKMIEADPSQRKLVLHQITSQGQTHRMLGASGINPIINPAPTINNYGPVFGSGSSFTANAPMLFNGDNITTINNANTYNRGIVFF